jgi:choice-of-anchor A domain-containing protein
MNGAEERSQSVCGPDTTPPVSTLRIISTPDASGIYHGPVQVELSATDDCSGVRILVWGLSGASNNYGNTSYFTVSAVGTTTIHYYAGDMSRNYEAPRSVTITIAPTCSPIRLNDFNIFVAGNYSGGHSIGGKLAAGGTLSLQDFSAGGEVPSDDTDNVLVAGNNLNTSTTADTTVSFSGGALAQGTPINFSARDGALKSLVLDMHENLKVNGTTRVESWGGVFLEGTHPQVNVFNVTDTTFSNAVYRSIRVPEGSVAVVNIIGYIGSTFTLSNASVDLIGVDARGVLYVPWGATTINFNNIILRGTVLAPWSDVNFTSGALFGAIYGRSMVGGAETHVSPLKEFEFCGVNPY